MKPQKIDSPAKLQNKPGVQLNQQYAHCELTVANLSICNPELKALTYWQLRHFGEHVTFHTVTHFAMLFALSYPAQFDRWLNSVRTYAAAEDILDLNLVRGRIAALYKRRKLALRSDL